MNAGPLQIKPLCPDLIAGHGKECGGNDSVPPPANLGSTDQAGRLHLFQARGIFGTGGETE